MSMPLSFYTGGVEIYIKRRFLFERGKRNSSFIRMGMQVYCTRKALEKLLKKQNLKPKPVRLQKAKRRRL